MYRDEMREEGGREEEGKEGMRGKLSGIDSGDAVRTVFLAEP